MIVRRTNWRKPVPIRTAVRASDFDARPVDLPARTRRSQFLELLDQCSDHLDSSTFQAVLTMLSAEYRSRGTDDEAIACLKLVALVSQYVDPACSPD